MPSRAAHHVCLNVCLILSVLVAWQAAAPRLDAEEATGHGAKLFDTGSLSSAPLSAEILSERHGWITLPEEETGHRFTGDVVLANGRLTVALRRGGQGAEVYANGARGPVLRALLTPRGGDSAAKLTSVSIAENNSGTVAVDAGFKTADGGSFAVRCQLDLGQVFLKTEAHQGAKALRVSAPCRFVVLPDFFADDIVVDATETPVARAELPSENFLLQMLPGGEAIVMTVAGSRGQDAVIGLSGKDAERVIDYSEIPYGKDGKIWVAVIDGQGGETPFGGVKKGQGFGGQGLGAPSSAQTARALPRAPSHSPLVWYQRDVARGDAGKIIPLNWDVPYSAQWRVDWRRDNKLTDSWEMLTQNPDGEYIKHGWFGQPESFGTPDWMKPARQRWTTVLGQFQYPCWIDKDGRGYLQPLTRVVRFQGPVLVYPINRIKATPLSVFTVVDVVRSTLGVGPCEYILDVEGQQKESRGIATCAARSKLNAIYEQRLQKQKRAEVEKALADVLAFVQHIRSRIDDYVAFGHEMLKYLAEQKKAHPELAETLTEMETLTQKIDQSVARRKAAIGTPAEAVKLVEDFRTRLVGYEGDDALKRCQEFGKAITTIGGNQDELVGECRMAVKVLRQRAGLAVALSPGAAEIAKQIRRRTQEALRNPASYEAPRH
jgi:hypothetical protein